MEIKKGDHVVGWANYINPNEPEEFYVRGSVRAVLRNSSSPSGFEYLIDPPVPYVSTHLTANKLYKVYWAGSNFVVIVDDRCVKTDFHHSWVTKAPKDLVLKQYFQC